MHSLSVSDVVVFNENGTVKAYFVDSISFHELPGFLRLVVPLKSVELVEETLLEDVREGKMEEVYKPLAKVEELEEANYNMIDNVLNNMPLKREPYLEYYAAECDEYHDLAKMYRGDDLEEVLARYRAIIEDPTLDYYGNGMGFIYRDPDNSLYDETEITIISGKSIHGDNLDHVAYMAAMPAAQGALEKIRATFPEYRYYPPKEVQEKLYGSICI